MMTSKRKTGFDRYFDMQMEAPKFASSNRAAEAEIDPVDTLISALDGARAEQNLIKAELARRIGARSELVQRLLTDMAPNPRWDAVLRLVKELD